MTEGWIPDLCEVLRGDSPPPRHPAAGAPLVLSPRQAWPRWSRAEPGLVSCRLHRVSGVLLDLPVTAPPGSQIRVATYWPTPGSPDGWAQAVWQPGREGRGLVAPPVTEIGDVLALAIVDTTVEPPPPRPAGLRGLLAAQPAATPRNREHVIGTWCGYLHGIERDALIMHGPFPSLTDAYGAAQQAQLRGLQPDRPPTPAVPTAPGPPPVTVSITNHGSQQTIGDPTHGWITVPTDEFQAALTLGPGLLRDLLAPHVGPLPASTAPVTLAALGARHLRDELPDLCLPPAYQGPATPTPAWRPAPGSTPSGPPPAWATTPAAGQPPADAPDRTDTPPVRRPAAPSTEPRDLPGQPAGGPPPATGGPGPAASGPAAGGSPEGPPTRPQQIPLIALPAPPDGPAGGPDADVALPPPARDSSWELW